jgi:hypothetical protein
LTTAKRNTQLTTPFFCTWRSIEGCLFLLFDYSLMIEFTILGSSRRITLDIKDIRAVVEQNEGTKILFYSDLKMSEWVAEDYDTVIKRLKRNDAIESYLKRR